MNFFRGFLSFILGSLLVLALLILGIVTTISMTILNPQFVTSQLDKFDIYSVATDAITSQLELSEEEASAALEAIITDLKPWLKEQTNTVIYSGYAYLKGDQELNIIISLESLKPKIEQSLKQYALSSLPPELAGASEDVVELYLSQVTAEIDKIIPKQFEINETSLGSEIMAGVNQARQIISYVKLAYIAAAGLAILMILFIAMTHRWRIKPVSRAIGIAFILVGIISAVVVLISRATDIIASRLAIGNDIISGFPGKLSLLISDITTPILIYGIVFLIAGIGLVILSALVKPSEDNKVAIWK